MDPDTRSRTKRMELQKDRFSLSVDKDCLRTGTIQ